MNLLRGALHDVMSVYYWLGLMYPITHTKRYIDFRPGDAFLFNALAFILVVIGIPLWVGIGLATGMTGWYWAGLVGLFLAPPALTIGYLEFALLYIRIFYCR